MGLFVSPTGAKSWHFRFFWAGKPQRISFGTYPEISLKKARALRDEARGLVATAIDPRVQRRQANEAAVLAADNTFKGLFERWRVFKALSLKVGRQSTLSQIDRIFANDVLPRLGKLSVFEIKRANVLDVLRRIERRQAHTTAENCRTWLNQLFRYEIVELDLETNPAADLDIVAVPKPPRAQYPAEAAGKPRGRTAEKYSPRCVLPCHP